MCMLIRYSGISTVKHMKNRVRYNYECDCTSVKNVNYIPIAGMGYILYVQFPSITSQSLPDNPCAMYVTQTVGAWSKPHPLACSTFFSSIINSILLRDLSTLSRADHLQISTGRDYRLISYLMPMALDWHSDVQRNANSNFVQKTCGLLNPKFLEDLV